jgi:Leucine-rich repeat (LRR) protein
MKKQYFLWALVFLTLSTTAQIINIPDANFKAKLLAASPSNSIAASGFVNVKIDTNNNNEIEVSEAQQITNLNVSIAEIYNSTGIEYFTNLRTLNFSQNHIPTLDVSNLTNLKSLYCNLNLLSSLDLTGLTNLLNLECAENILTQLIFANATSIQNLSCRFNFLPTLDVSGLTNLQTLHFDYNQLSTINLSNLTQLTELGFQSNQFTSIDLSALVNLVWLNCSFNQLSALDLTGLNAITTLNCANNQITSLDLVNASQLHLLNCEYNQISNPIILNGMSDLQSVYCHNNLIPSFDFIDLTSLEVLDCSANQIATLDVSSLPVLSLLNCHDNALLTYLNIKNGSNESFLDFSNNPNLLNICVDSEQLNTVQNLIAQYGYPNCQASSTCDMGTAQLGWTTTIKVYPNPAKNNIQVQVQEAILVNSVIVYDVLGRLVQETSCTSDKTTLDVSTLKTGTYFIKVNTDRGIANAKFLKE